MTDYLQELLAEGNVDSSGVFTLDAAEALCKLRSHRFASPEWYLLHAVAAAHLAGAQRMDIYVDADDAILAWDGSPLESERLSSLLSDYFNPDQPALYRQLTLAMLGASRLNPRFLWLDSQGQRLSWNAGRVQLSDLKLAKAPAFTTRLWLRRATSVEVVKRFLKQERPERTLLQKRCSLSSVQLFWHGTPLSVQNLPHGYLNVAVSEPPGMNNAPQHYQAAGKLSAEAAWLCFRGEQRPARVRLVQNGLLYEETEPSWPPGLEVWVWNARVKTDLSGAALVKNEAWNEFLRQMELLIGEVMLTEYHNANTDRPLLHTLLGWFVNTYWERWTEAAARTGVNLEHLSLVVDEHGQPIPLPISMKRYARGGAMFVGKPEDPGRFPDGTPIFRVRPGCQEALEYTHVGTRGVCSTEGRVAQARLTQAGSMLFGSRYLVKQVVGRESSHSTELALLDPADWPAWTDDVGPDNRLLRYDQGRFAEDILISPSRCKMPGGLEVVVESSTPLGRLVEGGIVPAGMVARLYFKLSADSATLFASPVRAHLCLLLRYLRYLHPDLARPQDLLLPTPSAPGPVLSWWQLFKGPLLSKMNCLPGGAQWVGLAGLKEVPDALPDWQRDILAWMLGKTTSCER